jgi:predicted transposase YbfD/YdcC
MFCGVICGAESWRDFSDFGESKLDYLRRFSPLKNGIPSKNTFCRVISSLNPEAFKDCFVSWIRSVQTDLGDVIAIDGKTLRRSFDNASGKAAIHMVSAFASDARLVLAQQKVDEKSNEITAIPKLLELLDINGAIITIDAMGCQKDIAQKIIDNNGDYVLALKGNQKKLHARIEKHFANYFDMKHHKKTDCHEEAEVNRGRIEERSCLATSELDWLDDRSEWAGLKSVVAVESKRTVNGSTTTEKRYFISSLPADAENISRAVRSHWGVENSLHWMMDVVFREDDSRVRTRNAAENMSVMKHVALNQLQAAKSGFRKDMSIKRLRKKAGWDSSTLDKILFTEI